MRRSVKWLLVSVLVVDAVAAALFLTGGAVTAKNPVAPTPAAADAAATDAADQEPAVTREALQRLADELRERQRVLDRRELELEEALRGEEVLARAGLAPAVETAATEAPPPDPAARSSARAKASGSDAVNPFTKLTRAYENMEPESAARALVELAERDRDAVVELLLGWKPRTSGAILDAMTQIRPALAAEISYEIWRRRGGGAPETDVPDGGGDPTEYSETP